MAALALALGVTVSPPLLAAGFDEAQTLYRTGHYRECLKLADQEIGTAAGNEAWWHLKLKCQLATGAYSEALTTFEVARREYYASISLRLLGREIYRLNGKDQEAAAELAMVGRLIQVGMRRYATEDGVVAIGRYSLLKGTDARKVLDQYFDAVTKQRPEYLDAHYATAELALTKEDYALAAESLRKAPKAAAQDPYFHYLRARAFSAEDRAGTAKALEEALKINPKHVDSLLLEADQLIDAERYAEAEASLKRALEVNPLEARAWALRAVLAYLRGDSTADKSARQKARDPWAKNPEVDHLIGRKLSQKYRFTDGARLQRASLDLDPEYMPAKVQLCQDLLRLGDESEGWKLAAEIFSKDGYNVVAFNLVTLRDRLAGFRTIETDGFIIRMDQREAELYGERVAALMSRAKATLATKYGVSLSEPVIVEIFPQRKEFAVRTFGLPGADGLLGVCFGRVITANSPASQGEHAANWEAVLWHEFCHVVTLSKTHNTMPRWLSEGISVYEEGLADPAWATPLNPRFRAVLLDKDLTPLSRLSSAFLGPKTPVHLQFAYFESALVVEFLVGRFGMAALQGLLEDLGRGMPLGESLPRQTKMSLVQLDEEFARYARERALRVAPGASWEEVNLPPTADSATVTAWLAKHPNSFEGQRRLAARLVTEQKWQEAKTLLEKLKALYPEYVGPDNPYLLLAVVFRHLGDSVAERAVLEELAQREGDSTDAYSRLMDLGESAQDWPAVVKNARRYLAVNPLVPGPYRRLASASEHLGAREEALAAYQRVALLDDTDPAETHFHLAKLLRESGKPAQARREVLRALEEAPRFRDAHRLLLELVEPGSAASSSVAPSLPPVRTP